MVRVEPRNVLLDCLFLVMFRLFDMWQLRSSRGSPASSGLLVALGGKIAELDPPGGLASFFGRPVGRFAGGSACFSGSSLGSTSSFS